VYCDLIAEMIELTFVTDKLNLEKYIELNVGLVFEYTVSHFICTHPVSNWSLIRDKEGTLVHKVSPTQPVSDELQHHDEFVKKKNYRYRKNRHNFDEFD